MAELVFDLNAPKREIRKRRAKKVIIQLPEGLKGKATHFAEEMERDTGAKAIVLIDPCYGACDIPVNELEEFNADLILHFGHTEMLKYENTVYVPVKYKFGEGKFSELVKKTSRMLKKGKFKRVGLVSTAQFLEYLPKMKREMEKAGFSVKMEKGEKTEIGQVLGCDVFAARKLRGKVDAFVYFGDGLFHPLGISFVSNKPLFMVNPLNESVKKFRESEKEAFLKKRVGIISKAVKAQSYGILVSTKLGQLMLERALELKHLVESRGKRAYLLAGDLIKEDRLLGMDIDCFVNTACPRIAIDDAMKWKKPLISAVELEIALKKKGAGEFQFP